MPKKKFRNLLSLYQWHSVVGLARTRIHLCTKKRRYQPTNMDTVLGFQWISQDRSSKLGASDVGPEGCPPKTRNGTARGNNHPRPSWLQMPSGPKQSVSGFGLFEARNGLNVVRPWIGPNIFGIPQIFALFFCGNWWVESYNLAKASFVCSDPSSLNSTSCWWLDGASGKALVD